MNIMPLTVLILDPRLSMGKPCNRIRKLYRQKEQGKGLPIASSDGLQGFDTHLMMDSTP